MTSVHFVTTQEHKRYRFLRENYPEQLLSKGRDPDGRMDAFGKLTSEQGDRFDGAVLLRPLPSTWNPNPQERKYDILKDNGAFYRQVPEPQIKDAIAGTLNGAKWYPARDAAAFIRDTWGKKELSNAGL